VRRHAGCPYEAGSYCNALQKCVKPFVTNGKCVIGLFDHSRGPPINRGSIITERTHINEKRALKVWLNCVASGSVYFVFFCSAKQ
jgi:hypothetical protein